MKFVFQLMTWVLFAGIVAVTLGPVTLRPHTHFSPDLDRFVAYAVLGAFFALSYPQFRLWLLGAFLITSSGILEWAQSLVPHRDPYFSDFLFKVGGSIIGLTVMRAIPSRHRRFVSGRHHS
jgi:hypothetical protein